MPNPVHVKDVEWSEWRQSEEIRIRFQELNPGSDAHIGVGICELDPGCRTEQ